MSEDFDSWHHLKRINDLFEKHGDKFAYKKFILEEQIFVKKTIHLGLFLGQKNMYPQQLVSPKKYSTDMLMRLLTR